MEVKPPVFEGIYRDYLAQLREKWTALLVEELGVVREGGSILVPLFGQVYRVSPEEIASAPGERPSHARCVVLAKYLLACPLGGRLTGQWTSYRRFKDAGPYADSFTRYAEGHVARSFRGRLAELARAGRRQGGAVPESGFAYDLCLEFAALPRLPLLLLFNDQEDVFPATCSLLFDESAPAYLDMECLAMLGLILSEALVKGRDAEEAGREPSDG